MSEQTLFKVTVDNITIEVPAGTTILQAARQIEVPLHRQRCVIIVSCKEVAASVVPV